jgi:serine/threonine protein kinase
MRRPVHGDGTAARRRSGGCGGRGPLPYDDFKELAQQTLEGLLSAHQHHVLHRDIKPENIKVERLPGGRMQSKIIDFGLARAGLRARKQTEDQDGTVMGSIFYMAPEQLTREPVDERTDLYSLGCVFYEALSGKKAFDGELDGGRDRQAYQSRPHTAACDRTACAAVAGGVVHAADGAEAG